MLTIGEEVAVTLVLGDVNGDGKLSTADARYVLLAILEATDPLTEQQQKLADMNCDGIISTSDVRCMLCAIAEAV